MHKPISSDPSENRSKRRKYMLQKRLAHAGNKADACDPRRFSFYQAP